MEVFPKVLHTGIGQTLAFTILYFARYWLYRAGIGDRYSVRRIISCGSPFAMLPDYTLLLLCFI